MSNSPPSLVLMLISICRPLSFSLSVNYSNSASALNLKMPPMTLSSFTSDSFAFMVSRSYPLIKYLIQYCSVLRKLLITQICIPQCLPNPNCRPYDEAVGVFYSPSVVVIYSRRFYYYLLARMDISLRVLSAAQAVQG